MNQNKSSVTPDRSSRKWLLPVLLALVIGLLIYAPSAREWLWWGISFGHSYPPKGVDAHEGPWRPWDQPTDPRELEAYEYAHALKLPEGLPQPVPFNFAAHWRLDRRNTGHAYFEHLCATEAGEYIFKTVDNVEGIYQMRAMPKHSSKLFLDRYGFEDPANWSSGEADGSPYIFIGGPWNGFRYFESRRSPEEIAKKMYWEEWQISPWTGAGEAPYWRYHHFNGKERTGQVDPIEQLQARYAYTWRGIRRDRDREYGVAGGELIVLDRLTGEILGVRRTFAVAPQYAKNLGWEFAYYCPGNLNTGKWGSQREINKIVYPFDFIQQILFPIDLSKN